MISQGRSPNTRLSQQLLLTKLRPGPLLVEDIPKNLSIVTVAHSRISSLYHALKNVYSPLLAEDDASEHSETDSHLQGLVMQLKAGLGSSLRQGQQVLLSEFRDSHCSVHHMSCQHPDCNSMCPCNSKHCIYSTLHGLEGSLCLLAVCWTARLGQGLCS